MEDLPLGRIAALVPEFAEKDLPLGQNTDDDTYTEGAEKHIHTLTADIYLLKSRIKKTIC